MNKDEVLELYRSYLDLQVRYRATYQALKRQYYKCQCRTCKMDLIFFGLELIRLNSFIEQMSDQLPPNFVPEGCGSDQCRI